MTILLMHLHIRPLPSAILSAPKCDPIKPSGATTHRLRTASFIQPTPHSHPKGRNTPNKANFVCE